MSVNYQLVDLKMGPPRKRDRQLEESMLINLMDEERHWFLGMCEMIIAWFKRPLCTSRGESRYWHVKWLPVTRMWHMWQKAISLVTTCDNWGNCNISQGAESEEAELCSVTMSPCHTLWSCLLSSLLPPSSRPPTPPCLDSSLWVWQGRRVQWILDKLSNLQFSVEYHLLPCAFIYLCLSIIHCPFHFAYFLGLP